MLLRGFPFRHPLLHQAIGDVIAHGEGVEQGAFLKHHTDAAAQHEQLLLAHLVDLFTEHSDGARVGPHQAID